MEIIPFGTKEFEEFVKNAQISPKEAKEIEYKFISSNNEYKNYKNMTSLFFIFKNNYIFTLTYPSKQKLKGTLLTGIWVNATSGEVKYNINNTQVEAKTFRGWIE